MSIINPEGKDLFKDDLGVLTYNETVMDEILGSDIQKGQKFESGSIGNWKITADRLIAQNGLVGMDSRITSGTDWRFWAGHLTPGSAPFRVDEDGNMFASSAVISGSIIGSEIHIPDEDTTANSFHVATDADTWWGCTSTDFTADNDNANAYVLKDGTAKFQSVNITGAGSSVNGSAVVGGWTASSTTLANGTNIVLDASNKKISINDATFGNSGIQIDYNSGTPRTYMGDGANQFFKYESGVVSFGGTNSSLTPAGIMTGATGYFSAVYEFTAFLNDDEKVSIANQRQMTSQISTSPSSIYVLSCVDGGATDDLYLYKFDRERYGNFTQKTARVLVATGASFSGNAGCAVHDGYLYVCYETAAAVVTLKRYDLDLTNPTSMTYDTPPGSGAFLCSNDTYLYHHRNGSAVLEAYAISGTNATDTGGSDITLATSSGYYPFCDGTYIYTIGSNTIYKHNMSGVQQSTQPREQVSSAYETNRVLGTCWVGLDLATGYIIPQESGLPAYYDIKIRTVEI